MNEISVIIVLVASIIGAVGAVLFKISSERLSLSIKVIKNKALVVGVVLYGISLLMFVVALRYGELSVLYPLASTIYIWVTLFSIKFLGETVNQYKLLGIVLIIIGVSLVSLS